MAMAFISHLGSVIKFDISTEPKQNWGPSSDDKLMASSFKFSSNTRCFEPAGRSEGLPLACRNHRIIKVRCILEEGTGNMLPCVVIQSQSEESHGCFLNSIIFYIPQSHKLFIYGRFCSDVPLCRDTLWLADGPVVYWIDQCEIMCGSKGRDFMFGAQAIPSIPEESCHGRKIKLAWVDRSQITHMILARSSNKSSTENDSDESDDSDDKDYGWVEFRSRINVPGKCSIRLKVFREVSLFPTVYTPITLCIQSTLTDVSRTGHLSKTGKSNSNVTSKSSPNAFAETEQNVTVIATSMKQLLKFRNGKLCQMVWIPFDDAVNIVAMEMGGENMFAVQSQGGQVCLVRDSSFQVFKEWNNVASIQVDSFLANGQDQLLLLLNTSKTSLSPPFPDFVLTDLGLCLITSDELLHDGKEKVRGQGVPASQTSQCPKNLLTTVQALQSRVQQGVTALKEQEVGCRQKQRMIQQSLQALQHVAAGESVPSHRQPSLVHLCGTILQGGMTSPAPPTAHEITGRLKVSDAWQRVIDEKWVIGCKVTNQSRRPVSNICLWLLPRVTESQQEAIESEGYIRHSLSSSRISKEKRSSMRDGQQPPPVKMMKLDTVVNPWSSKTNPEKKASCQGLLEQGRTTDAVAMTTVPDFREGPVFSCQLAVQWISHKVDDDNDGQAHVQGHVCGSAVLNASDVGGDKLDIQMPHAGKDSVDVLSRVDELALNATQSTSCLVVASKYTQLTCLPRVLSDMGFHMLGSDCHICLEGALQRMRVYFREMQKKSAQITVCVKDKRQLMLFRHTLLSRLPDDVSLSTDTPAERIEDAITSGISQISIELDHTQEMLKHATSTPGFEVPMESGRVEDEGAVKDEEKERIERLRRDFQTESSSRAEHCLLSEDGALLLRKTLIELKYKTDDAIAALSEVVSTG